MRFFLEFSYRGTNYHGWQKQPNANTVQEEINQALTKLLNQDIQVVGAGRTDTGVHAKQMFAHFDFHDCFNIEDLIFRLNSFLPQDIVIYDIFRVKDDAHCRFDALSRTYQYHIVFTKSPFDSDVYFLKKRLNVEAMNDACMYILGNQDYTSFAKLHAKTSSNMCDVMFAKWEVLENQLVFTIQANRFLRNMVRAIVGTLLDVGLAKISPESIKDILASKNRCKAGTSVPANALFLIKVDYHNEIKL